MFRYDADRYTSCTYTSDADHAHLPIVAEAFIEAARLGNTDIVDYLIEFGTLLKHSHGYALSEATAHGELPTVQVIVNKCADKMQGICHGEWYPGGEFKNGVVENAIHKSIDREVVKVGDGIDLMRLLLSKLRLGGMLETKRVMMHTLTLPDSSLTLVILAKYPHLLETFDNMKLSPEREAARRRLRFTLMHNGLAQLRHQKPQRPDIFESPCADL
jgi:hypothetical protein